MISPISWGFVHLPAGKWNIKTWIFPVKGISILDSQAGGTPTWTLRGAINCSRCPFYRCTGQFKCCSQIKICIKPRIIFYYYERNTLVMNLLENTFNRCCVTVAETWQIASASISLDAWLLNCPSWIFDILQGNHEAFSSYAFEFEIRCSRKRFSPPNFLEFRAFTKVRKVAVFGLPKELLKIYSIEIFSRFHVDNMMFFQGVEDD